MPEKTPIYVWHGAHGGKLVEFAGFSLPVMYGGGILAEHLTTRRHGGLFDISHMGRFVVGGPGALAFLDATLTNRDSSLPLGQAHYTLSPIRGGPLDDAYLFRFWPDRWLLVVNGANHAKDRDWLTSRVPEGVELEDLSAELAMLALQGPASDRLLAAVLGAELPPAGRNHLGIATWREAEVLVSRTGYSGEPLGFELFLPASRALEFWEALVAEGAPLGVVPVGLGARDTLRLEAGLPLYGHELRPDEPIMALPQARFGVDLDPARGDFLGRRALMAQAEDLKARAGRLVPRRLSLVAALDKGMMREGSPIYWEGRPAGVLTSGTTVPAWRFTGGEPGGESYTRALGIARLDVAVPPDAQLEVEYRGRRLRARPVKSFAAPAGPYLRPREIA